MTQGWLPTAERLARAVTRRERLGAFALRAGLVLCAGAALAFALARGVDRSAGLLALIGAGVAAVGLGVAAARRVSPTRTAAAAWALDRLAGASESGLVAALAPAAAPPDVPAPPRVRLKPATGLPVLLGGVLLAALVVLAPAPESVAARPGPARDGGQAEERVVGSVEAAAGAQANSAETEAQALEAARVRAALGLDARPVQDARAVAERLQDPETLQAARAAAQAGGALARALEGGAAAADELARALAAASAAGEDLATARRAALAEALERGPAPAPPSRAALVERYVAARARADR